MKMPLRALILVGLLAVACAAPTPVPTLASTSPTAAPTVTVATATATQNPDSACGLLVAYAADGDPKFLLTLTSGSTTTQYRLSGAGTAPTDMGDLFVAKTPQLLAITGRQITANTGAPQAINLMDFNVTRVASCATGAAPSPIFGASECTNATATTRQVIERYLALSTSSNVQAVTDCFAKVWRDKVGTPLPGNSFADFAASWSKSGPVTNVTITFGDTVNGCDRFRVNAQLSNPSAGVYQVPPFFTVGPEAGRPRIFETGTALLNSSLATTRCQ